MLEVPVRMWLWFGMWLFAAVDVALVWWVALDALSRSGGPRRFLASSVAMAGLVLQLPALTSTLSGRAGVAAVLLGIAGAATVGVTSFLQFMPRLKVPRRTEGFTRIHPVPMTASHTERVVSECADPDTASADRRYVRVPEESTRIEDDAPTLLWEPETIVDDPIESTRLEEEVYAHASR